MRKINVLCENYSSGASSMTSPLIFRATIGTEALEATVMVFRMGPIRSVSYFTSMISDAPGAMGASGFFGMVQPQEERTCVILSSEVPVLVNLN